MWGALVALVALVAFGTANVFRDYLPTLSKASAFVEVTKILFKQNKTD
jgi:hypothetical protein